MSSMRSEKTIGKRRRQDEIRVKAREKVFRSMFSRFMVGCTCSTCEWKMDGKTRRRIAKILDAARDKENDGFD